MLMIPNRHHQLRPFPWALTSATYLISPLRHLHKHLQRNTLKMEFDVLLIFNPAAAAAAAAAAKLFQSCPTLCDPIDGSPCGSSVPGILQTRTLEWVAISFSNAWKWKVKMKSFSRGRLFVTPWTAAYQAPPPSMGFSRQEYWSGSPLPSPIKISYKSIRRNK